MKRTLLLFLLMISLALPSFAKDIDTMNAGEKSMINQLRTAINNNDILRHKNIIIGAGTSGCRAFQTNPGNGGLYVLLVWQWLDDIKNVSENTIIIVPEHALDERFESLSNRVKFIKISGVLHTKTIENIKSISDKNIDTSTEYIAMLAGDTQQENGQWVMYDQKMLLQFMDALPKNKNVLILNGPRTGKHIMSKGVMIVDESAHKDNTDYITNLAKKIAHDTKWKVVDFKYGQKSLWDEALKFSIENPHVGLILPGESTSMISEALSLGIKPIVYSHQAMTPTSKNYINQLAKQNKIIIYPKLNAENFSQKPTPNQAEKIISELSK